MSAVDELKVKYLSANAWQIGDSPELANELADLIKKGIKTASCGSFASYLQEELHLELGVITSSLIAKMYRYALSGWFRCEWCVFVMLPPPLPERKVKVI